MISPLSLDEEKQILSLYIAPATGRPRELLDVLLDVYPCPINEDQLKQRLSMDGKFALKSVLRNAKIFIDLHKRYDASSKQWYYRLDDSCIRIAKMNRFMNQFPIPC